MRVTNLELFAPNILVHYLVPDISIEKEKTIYMIKSKSDYFSPKTDPNLRIMN